MTRTRLAHGGIGRAGLGGVVSVALLAASGACLPTRASAVPAGVPIAARDVPAAAPAVHDVVVTGAGASTYPSFDAATERYAIVPDADTAGRVTVRATTSDPDGVVLIDGREVADGARTVTGLEPGDEISVLIDDVLGRAVHSFIYLPVGFPQLSRDPSVVGQPSAGHVMLTLGLWTEPSPFFETAVDANGVPAMVHETTNAMDLKRQPNGHYSVARTTQAPGRTGADVVELDEQFREVARHRTVGLTDTDGHDSILLPDGSAYLLAYEPNPATGLVDAVVQQIGADGTVLFEWSSADHVDVARESVIDDTDYAHVNSIEVMDDGDLLVSFRHLSSVFKIARTAHDGYGVGDVVWRLGGRLSDFTFVDGDGEPDGGPCAQHTARPLPNGNILTFDNGAWNLNPLCIDPSDPSGAVVARTPTRIAEWHLDETAGVATMVRDDEVEDRYAIFAGSAQRLANGSTVVGWASSRDAVASELGADGELLWDLQAVDQPAYFTYRAYKTDVDDVQAPQVVTGVVDKVTYRRGQSVDADITCTDRGGSSLRTCSSSGVDTRRVGTHTLSVSATDGAGNRTVAQRRYEVVAARPRADALVKLPGGRFIGNDRYGVRPRQQVVVSVPGRRAQVAVVRVQNDGTTASRFRLSPVLRSRAFSVRLVYPSGQRPAVLAPGESWTVRVRVRATRASGRAARIVVPVTAAGVTGHRDTVWLRLRR